MNTHCYNIENTCQYYKYLRDYGECASCGSIHSSPLPDWVELYLMPYYEDGGLHHKLFTCVLDVAAENLGNVFGL